MSRNSRSLFLVPILFRSEFTDTTTTMTDSTTQDYQNCTQAILDSFSDSIEELKGGNGMSLTSNKMPQAAIDKIERDLRADGFPEDEFEFVHETQGTKELFTMRRRP